MKVKDFNLKQTLECGQCFNFEELPDGSFAVVAFGRALHVMQKGDELFFLNADEDDIKNIWIPYFDLDRDYAKIKKSIIKADKRLEAIIKEYYGIHILKQEFAETLISFIISQNNNIVRIKKLVRKISNTYGVSAGCIEGKEYFAFPDPERLKEVSEEELRELKTGFRAPYITDAVGRLVSGEISQAELKASGYEKAKEKLTCIKGVGDKVANCVLLFGLGFTAAFPVDVWIKRIMEELYFNGDTDKSVIENFAKEKFGESGGFAQQYLFIYAQKSSKKTLAKLKMME